MTMKPLLDAAVTFKDAEILAVITLYNQKRVLLSFGWGYEWCCRKTRCERWSKVFPAPIGKETVVAVSLVPADRINRIADLVHVLAALEDVPVLRVVMMLVPNVPIS